MPRGSVAGCSHSLDTVLGWETCGCCTVDPMAFSLLSFFSSLGMSTIAVVLVFVVVWVVRYGGMLSFVVALVVVPVCIVVETVAVVLYWT